MASANISTPVWFITGCSTGLGRALAERVLQHGHRASAYFDPRDTQLGKARHHTKTAAHGVLRLHNNE